MRRSEILELQHDLNHFTNKFLVHVGPLMVDGVEGHATRRRVRTVKYYLGYSGKEQKRSKVTSRFLSRLRNPKNPRFSAPKMLVQAAYRRAKQRRRARKPVSNGVGHFDGRPVANWLIPYLTWAREHGWRGTLTSGWRDPVYSEHLCYVMCGAPSCSGKCAGRSSNHSGSSKPRGAIDVSDYYTFGNLMRRCPYAPRIFNALGARDPVHFSASGN